MANNMIFALLVFFSQGCEHLGLIFKPPSTIKAVIEGRIKGMDVRCEKVLSLGHPRWELMCKVGDNIDIKYRSRSFANEQTGLEIVIDKKKGEKRKVIAAPVLLVRKDKPVRLRTIANSADIDIQAEPQL